MRSMSGEERELSPPRVLVPRAPVHVAGFREVSWLSPEGEIEALAPAEARSCVEHEAPMLCHARAAARRLGMPLFPALDLLELFPFVQPGAVLRADTARPRRGARARCAARFGVRRRVSERWEVTAFADFRDPHEFRLLFG
jgi:hypothetical protein